MSLCPPPRLRQRFDTIRAICQDRQPSAMSEPDFSLEDVARYWDENAAAWAGEVRLGHDVAREFMTRTWRPRRSPMRARKVSWVVGHYFAPARWVEHFRFTDAPAEAPEFAGTSTRPAGPDSS